MQGMRFPGRYVQGPGALARLGREVAPFGRRVACVVDRGVFDRLAPTLSAAAEGAFERFELVRHGGECTLDEIGALAEAARAAGAEVLIGVGGGKALDTAKAAARRLGIACVVAPTIAASDAPCSALSVIYRADGTVERDEFLPRNPDLVLVDTAIIAAAPSRFLAAGIGDALATWYEAEACRRSGALNMFQVRGLPLAYQIARSCRDAIFAFGEEALAENDRHEAGPALERVVEANILLSGIGFESGGVAAAHAIHHGLSELDDVHHCLHGEKVAIGVLAQLRLEGAPEAEFEEVRAFCRRVRLPTRLADLGIADAGGEVLNIIARRACRPGEIVHNEPFPVTEAMVVDALSALI